MASMGKLPFALKAAGVSLDSIDTVLLTHVHGAHWGSQHQVGAAIFLSASKAREKTRSHREHGMFPNSS